MTIVSDASTPPSAKKDAGRSFIKPISRIRFDISDRDAFDRCIGLVIDWMEERPKLWSNPRSGIPLPPEAKAGQTFDITEEFGANPTRALRIDAADGSLWAARLDFHDPQHPRTWVSEFYVKNTVSRLVEFGTQLTCVIRGECPPLEFTRPNIVRTIIRTLSAEADGRQLNEAADIIGSDDVPTFVDLLQSRDRRLPIIAISDTEAGERIIAPDALARIVTGAAHVVHLTREGAWALTREIGKRFSTFSGAVRLYQPGLTEEAGSPFEHPLWLFKGASDPSLLKTIATRVLPAPFLKTDEEDQFLRFALVRRIAVQNTVLRNAYQPESSLEYQNLMLKDACEELTEERDTLETLALEEQGKRLGAEAEIERLKDEIRRLKAKSDALEHRRNEKPEVVCENDDALIPLGSYEDLEEWARDVLGENIYIHPAALKDCRKNGHPSMLQRIADALIVIRDYWIPAKMKGGEDLWELAHTKLQELGMKDSQCFVDRSEAKRTPGYSVVYEGIAYVTYDHIKYGNGYDNTNQIRIYYFWDDQKSRFVVGKMPSHLRNNLTT
jgi:hypothetical protein